MAGVWWNQISKARHFVEEIENTLLEGKSVLLCLPESLPWYDEFKERISDTLHQMNGGKRLQTIDCPTEDVGQYLLDHFVRKDTRITYRYGKTYAQFLGERTDITLSDHYLWVRGVTRAKYEEWAAFIEEYLKTAGEHRHAVFLLETKEECPSGKWGIKSFAFSQSIDAYDRFAFCALAASDNKCRVAFRPYLAELLSNLCAEDVELCASCVEWGESFLWDPEYAILNTVENQRRSDGTPFAYDLTEKEKRERIWQSQIRILFPIIEQYRNAFVERHYQEIESHLPVKDGFGTSVDNPQDLDTGVLLSMVGARMIEMKGQEEYDELVAFRNARNALAHFDIVSWSEAERILTWTKRQGKAS